MEGIDFGQAWAWLTKDTGGGWVVGLGAVLALAVIVLAVRKFRQHKLARFGRAVTMPLIMAWEAQGLFILAVAAHAPGLTAYVFATAMALILATLAGWADEHYKEHGNLGWPGRLVWMVSIPMGIAVSFTAEGPAEAVLRLILPALVLVLWWVKYAPVITTPEDGEGGPKQKQGGFRFTPRRIFVRLGWIDPTDADLNVVHFERQVRAITAAALALHHGGDKGRERRGAKLRKVSEDASPEMVEEAARRVNLVHHIEHLTDPSNYKAPEINTPEQREADPLPTEADEDQAGEFEEAGKDEPVTVPAQNSKRGPGPSEEQDRAAARELYVQSLQAGAPISGAQLARRFKRRYPGWGLDRIKEVRESINDSQEIPVQTL